MTKNSEINKKEYQIIDSDNNIFNKLKKIRETFTEKEEESKYCNLFSYNCDTVKFNIVNINSKNNKCLNIFFHGYTAIKSNNELENLIKSINVNEDNDATLIHWDSGNITKTLAEAVTNEITNKFQTQKKTFEMPKFNSIINSAKEKIKETLILIEDDFGTNQNKTDSLSNNIDFIIDEHYKHNKHRYINLIGHSLGGRIIINGLNNISEKYKSCVNNIVIMGGAVPWNQKFYQFFPKNKNSKLYNLYSLQDRVLLAKPDQELCIGRNLIPEDENFRIKNIHCEEFGHTDYWPNFAQLCEQYKLLETE